MNIDARTRFAHDFETWLEDPMDSGATYQLDRMFRYAIICWIRQPAEDDKALLDDALMQALSAPGVPETWRTRWSSFMDLIRDAGRQP